MSLIDKKLHKEIIKNFDVYRNLWVKGDYTDLYYRKAKRVFDGKICECFDISNITVFEKYQKQGVFTNLLDFVEKQYPEKTIFVENVLTPHLKPFLQKRGYTRLDAPYGIDLPCFYKMIK